VNKAGWVINCLTCMVSPATNGIIMGSIFEVGFEGKLYMKHHEHVTSK